MEKSIENIWSHGFLEEGAMVAPKINKLYEVKSINTIDKFRRMYHKNYWFIWLLMAVNFIGAFTMANIYLAVYMAGLFVPILVLSKKQITLMDGIDQTGSSFQYLRTFDDWLQKMIDDFRLTYLFFYPLYFLGMVSFLALIKTGDKGGNVPLLYQILADEKVLLVGGVPVIWLGSIILLTAIVAYFSPKLYMLDIRLVYGRIIDRLKNMLKEMEELKG